MMSEVHFLQSVKGFDPDTVNEETVELLEPYLKMSDFKYESAKRSSGNVAGLCTWVHSMVTYCGIAKYVRPLQAQCEMQQRRLEESARDAQNR